MNGYKVGDRIALFVSVIFLFVILTTTVMEQMDASIIDLVHWVQQGALSRF